MGIIKDFKDFIIRGNIIDLAVGVVIGIAFNQVVNSLVNDIINPLISLFTGGIDFSAFKVGPFYIGKFLNSVISFLIVSASIYFFIVLPLNKLNKLKNKNEQNPSSEPPEDVKLLREILEVLKSQNQNK
jgi:large conductance mechanosensitive channel